MLIRLKPQRKKLMLISAQFVAALLLMLGLTACGDDSDNEQAGASADTKQNTVEQQRQQQAIEQAALVRSPPAGEVIGFSSPNGAFTWLGIPFAQPPVGDLRWRAPQPMEAWEGSLLAGSFASPCVQLPVDMPGSGIDPNANYGDEDCLYLNIYAPPTLVKTTTNVAGQEKLPVMFWIHGGGNTIGEASQFDGSLLAMQQNVVVVTINYRLGIFGWFKQQDITGDGASEADRSGNFGTLDMIRALEWTRDNIEAFGGDANNVTIFGESAGGRNVVSLLTSPLSEGLFHRAIAQSGNSFFIESEVAEFHHPFSGNALAEKFVAAHGLNNAAKARDIDAHQLLNGINRSMGGGLPLLDVPNAFRDGYVIPFDAGLQAFRSGNYRQVPLMVGTNRDEDKLFMYLSGGFTKTWFGFWQTLKDADSYHRDAYYRSVRWRIAGAEALARAIEAPVYVYRFDWDELATPLGMDFPAMLGAAHGLEISFVFGEMSMGDFDQILITEDNAPGRAQLSQAMMAYWANFARSGNPNLGVNVPAQWLPWSAEEQYLVLDTDSEENTGIRMSNDTTRFKDLMQQLKADNRFDSQQERCGLLFQLSRSSPQLLAWKTAIGC